MQKTLCALAALLLASCSNDWSAGLADKRLVSAAPKPGQQDAAASPSFASARALAQRSFASAPDLGSLVQYPNEPVVRRNGAYTWHAALLSEDHALRSTVTGNLSFTAPDGTVISLKYERHVEHSDGNWSWIGRGSDERAESTVITFGEDAAFGTIPQRDGLPLRLTVGAGRSWVVSTDPRLLREVNNEATDPTGPDFLVPPKLAASTGSTSEMEAMGAEAASTTVSGKTVVDVLVGYTNGYSSYLGGTSAAITRVHNLVDITNQAYVNSKVEAEIRLVHAMQVSYPDATANKTALEEMTGFKAPSTRTTSAPAFSGLRSARDLYGADLVVLLRRFQEPESDGCGIAWLIGGGRSGIDSSDEYFGYSVVGDGQDTGTDGKTYFCREETFAHEIGHNMGSQHDSESAKKDDGSLSYGAYSYSFGYKTTATNGDFHTVMAYGDNGQTRDRVFSNPDIAICGKDKNLVCGEVDKADNARSLRNSIPTVSSFRAPVARSHPNSDINGDGKADILWHNPAQSRLAYWFMSGVRISESASFNAPTGFVLLGTGDFDGNGRAELLWSGDGRIYSSTFTATGFTGTLIGSHDNGWIAAAADDINGDNNADIIWHNPGQSRLAYWFMNGANIIESALFNAPSGIKLLGTADLDGNGRAELLWSGNGAIYSSTFTGSGFNGALIGSHDSGWIAAAADDINGDGNADIIWHNPAQSRLAYWLMNGQQIIDSAVFNAPPGFKLLGTGDFDGNGRAELLWSGDGAIYSSTFNGNGFTGALIGSHDSGWLPTLNALAQ